MWILLWDGLKKITINFLPDVYVIWENCKGQTYKEATLEIKYKNKNIYEILQMTINESVIFFKNNPQIKNKIQILQKVELAYMNLGGVTSKYLC